VPRDAITPRQRFIAARAGFVILILIATLTHIDAPQDTTAAFDRLQRAFKVSLGWRDAIDIIRNVVLFAGFGAVWVVTSLTGRVRSEVPRAIVASVLVSVTVESLQILSPVRTASLVDVAMNIVGAVVGAVCVAKLIAIVRASRGAPRYLGVPMYLLASAYWSVILCEALAPLFRSDLLTGIEGGPLSRLREALRVAMPLSIGHIPVVDVILFAPAGFLAVMLLVEERGGRTRPWPWVAGGVAALVVMAHVAHGMVGLPVRFEAAATDAIAVMAGGWLASKRLLARISALRGTDRMRNFILAYGGLLVLWGWRPFVPRINIRAIAAQFSPIHLIPLASLSEHKDFSSAVHVAQIFLLYLPLGGLLAVSPLERAGRWSYLRPALWLALAVEVGHVLISGRFLDVTNALIAWAGLLTGWMVMRRAGYVRDDAAGPGPAPVPTHRVRTSNRVRPGSLHRGKK
jgi:glycopeptide antibiotics resistance protein